jgi:release factor glutamine methyltransferase
MTTVAEAIAEATSRLQAANVDDARREARLLVGAALKKTPTQVFNDIDDEIGKADADLIGSFITRRSAGEPSAYILEEREFWSLPLKVSPATLIPRPDSETMVEMVLNDYDGLGPRRILDLGTGSGCLLLALLSEYPDATGVGVDISPEAVSVAIENAEQNDLSDRCQFIQGSWTDNIDEHFDLIVSNPPYIPKRDINDLEKDVREYEPHGALDGGEDGLDMYRAIFSTLNRVLSENGRMVVEIGISQAEDVVRIAEQNRLNWLNSRKDISGIVRVLMFAKKSVGNTGPKR